MVTPFKPTNPRLGPRDDALLPQEEGTRERRLSFREMSLSEGFDATASDLYVKKKMVTTSVGGGFVTSKKEVVMQRPALKVCAPPPHSMLFP